MTTLGEAIEALRLLVEAKDLHDQIERDCASSTMRSPKLMSNHPDAARYRDMKTRGWAMARAALAPESDEDLVERISLIIEKHLQEIKESGYLVEACDSHGQDFVVNGGCSECAADGGSGELCQLALDSESIELARLIVAALAKTG